MYVLEFNRINKKENGMSNVTIMPSSTVGADVLENNNWLCNCFALPSDAIDGVDLDRRLHSPTDYMVGDHTLGGSVCLNPPAGWTESADIPAGFGMLGTPESGYGTFQGESIMANLDLVHLRAGIPEYNSLSNFYNRLFDLGSGQLANEGKSGVLNTIIDVAVKAAGWYISIPILPFVIAGRFVSWLSDKPYSAYYYLRPSMDLFWMAFNTAANALAINMGLGIQGELKRFDSSNGQRIEAAGLSEAAMESISNILPDIYQKNGRIDIFAASTRHKRLQKGYAKYLASQVEQSSSFETMYANIASTSRKVLSWGEGGFSSIVEMMSAYASTTIASDEEDVALTSTSENTTEAATTNSALENPMVANAQDKQLSFYESDYASHASAMAVSGGDFITFAVDYVRDVSFSISNSTGESSVSSSINSIVSSARGGKFTTMHGNIGDGLLANGVEGMIDVAKQIGASAADFANLNILTAMAGNGFVDIPDVWQSSETDMPGLEYSFTIEAPSAHPLAKFQMMLPVLALLCLAAPRSTGTKSYTSPFLVECAHVSRNHCPMGVIKSLNIDFGPERDDYDMALSAKVTFQVANLSNKLHVPLSADTTNFFDEDSNFNDMLKIMGGVTLHDRDSVSAAIKRRYSGWLRSLGNYSSSAYWANQTIGRLSSGALGWMLPVTHRN